MTLDQPAYPIQFAVDYPEAPLNRLTSFFRLVTMIPIVVVVALVSGGSGSETGIWRSVTGICCSCRLVGLHPWERPDQR